MSLGKYREARGLTLDAVGAAVGVRSKGYLSRLEGGREHASIRLALRIQDWSGGAVRAESLVSSEDAALLQRYAGAPPSIAATGRDTLAAGATA